MKRIILYLVIFVSITNISAMLEVSLDGTKPFTVIQEALDCAASNDTVLVYPGRYFENLDLSQTASVCLYSLEAMTSDTTLISATILDGIHGSDSIIKLVENISVIEVRGFTITNGRGFSQVGGQGGGVCLIRGNLRLINNIIKKNYGSEGGGIYLFSPGTLYLEGCIITENIGTRTGGGLSIVRRGTLPPTITFSEENRCSIFNNYAPFGTDLCWDEHFGASCEVYLNKFTVDTPQRYYANYVDSYSLYEAVGFSPFAVFDIEEGVVTEVNCDLYVSNNGNDNNSGLNPNEPLRTTFKAFQKVASNLDNPNTIHLPEGLYKNNIWGHENIPIALKSGTKLVGVSPEATRLEGNDEIRTYNTGVLCPSWSNRDMTIENIGITSQSIMVICSTRVKNLKLKNLIIEDCNIEYDPLIQIGWSIYTTVDMQNVIFRNNVNNPVVGMLCLEGIVMTFDNVTWENNTIGYAWNPYVGLLDVQAWDKIIIKNCTVINNTSNISEQYSAFFRLLSFDSDSLQVVVDNSLFANNDVGGCINNFYFIGAKSTVVNNCTFANNQINHNLGLINLGIGQAYVKNCIFYNNNQNYEFSSGPINVKIDNCIFDSDEVNFHPTYAPSSYVIGDDNQYLTNPLFVGGNPEYSSYYMLVGNDLGECSPAIDSGSIDLGFLPNWYEEQTVDLFGLDRIIGSSVDIGCYEYQGFTSNTDIDVIPEVYRLEQNYPNPFNPETTITFYLPKANNVLVEVYNIKGQKVTTLVEKDMLAGSHSLVWNGRDSNNKKVASGVYFYKMRSGKYSKTKKMVLMK